MFRLMIYLGDLFAHFERWFNLRFGWFFTNGMKGGRRPFKA